MTPEAAGPAVTTGAGAPRVERLHSPGLTWFDIAVLIGLAIVAARLAMLATIYLTAFLNPVDAYHYWQIWHGPMYIEGARLFEKGNIYSPAFGVAMWPLSQLAWPVFASIWSAAGLFTFAWLLRPIPFAFRLPLLAACLLPIAAGNVEWLLALLLVVGGPAGWAFAALTKVTPAIVGPVWYATRREWRNVAIAIAVPSLVALVSFALMPDLWFTWIGVLIDSARLSPTGGLIMPPLVARVPVAVSLTVWAARTERAWVLPIAMIVAQPDPTWTTAALLAACPRLAGNWRQDPVLRTLRPAGAVGLGVAAVVAAWLIQFDLGRMFGSN